jgi:antirestriction protein ArdC
VRWESCAELASAFVANDLGIPTDIPHHAGYIASWIKPHPEYVTQWQTEPLSNARKVPVFSKFAAP